MKKITQQKQKTMNRKGNFQKTCLDLGIGSHGLHFGCQQGNCHNHKHSGEGKIFQGIPYTNHGYYYNPKK
ncbi:hypothetical protein pb186bvf_006649 [Paramecium bursaria]